MPDPIDTRYATPRRSDDDPTSLACTAPLPASSVRAPVPRLEDPPSHVPGGPAPDYSVAVKNPALRQGFETPRGIELASIAKVPESSRDDPSRAIACPPYVLHAELARGSTDVAYYAAYNREAGRTEYIVKPEAVDAFEANVTAFKAGANVTLMNGGPTREYQKESIRAVDSVMHQEYGEATGHLAKAWSEAVTDPAFYAQVAISSAVVSAGPLAGGTPSLRLLGPVARDDASLVTSSAARLVTASDRPMINTSSTARTLPIEGNVARAPAPAASPVSPPLTLVASNARPAVRTPIPSAAATPVTQTALRGATPIGGAHGEEPLACDPHPLGYHRGNDAIHNACADAMGNVYPGSDFVVAGKAFDGLTPFGELVEVKTGYPSQYRGEGPERVFKAWVAEAKADGDIATACGYRFVFAVADPEAIDALKDELRNQPNVEVRAADQDECVR